MRINVNIFKFGVKAVFFISPCEAYFKTRAGSDQCISPTGNHEETELAGGFGGGGGAWRAYAAAAVGAAEMSS